MPNVRGGEQAQPSELRIIGGVHARRKLRYAGDLRTRPMKDRVREAVFNLIGPAVVGTHAIDLFAGTGALGLEAISRGAARATFFEQHFPTADVIGKNVATLGVNKVCQVIAADTFRWFQAWSRSREQSTRESTAPVSARQELSRSEPWLVFCSPPYDFYVERREDMLALLTTLVHLSPAGSILVVEANERFDFGRLPDELSWDVREYPPARIAIGRKELVLHE